MTNKEKYNQVFIDSFSITADQLNENLVYFEDQELYEECAKINTAIKSLIKTK